MAPGLPAAGLRRGGGRSASHNNLLGAFSPVFDLELLELDGGGAAGCLDRRWSHLSLGAGGGGAPGAAAARLAALLRGDGSLFTCQLWQELLRLRAAYAPPADGAGGGEGAAGGGDAVMAPAPALAAAAAAAAPALPDGAAAAPLSRASSGAASGSSSARSGLEAAGHVDIEAIACALLAAGYLVQLRDEAPAERPRDARACLQQLRHRFIVCTGARGGTGDGGGPHHAHAGPGGGPDPMVTDAVGDAHYLPEPLVVEPRFREQFVIAQPTPAYEALLEVRGDRAVWGGGRLGYREEGGEALAGPGPSFDGSADD
jgi:hypothetical protein